MNYSGSSGSAQGHAQRLHKLGRQLKRQQEDCSSPYVAPASGAKVEAFDDVDLEWSMDCFDEDDLIDIYLYDVSGDSATPLHGWANVPTADGNLTTTLYPNWWNATEASDRRVQLQFVASGDPLWATSFGTGPVFTVTWDGESPPPAATSGGDWDKPVESITKPTTEDSPIGKGGMAAAIVVPILVAIGALIGYLIWNKRKSQSRPKRWSSAVENRMSMMSSAGDSWQPPAPRPGSIAYSHMTGAHNRSSSAESINMLANAAGVGRDHPLGASRTSRQSMAVSINDAPSAAPSPDRASLFNSRSSKAGARQSLSGEVMKELLGNRSSRVSFAASNTSPSKDRSSHAPPSRPAPSLQMPRLGQNGLRASTASTGDVFEDAEVVSPAAFRRGHGHQASATSSLRHEYGQAHGGGGGRDSIFSSSDLSKSNNNSNNNNSNTANMQGASPPHSAASRRLSRFSGYFNGGGRDSRYSDADSSYSSGQARPTSHVSHNGGALSPDAALAAYSEKAQVPQLQPAPQSRLALPESSSSNSNKKGGKVSAFFRKGAEVPPPVPVLPPQHSPGLSTTISGSNSSLDKVADDKRY